MAKLPLKRVLKPSQKTVTQIGLFLTKWLNQVIIFGHSNTYGLYKKKFAIGQIAKFISEKSILVCIDRLVTEWWARFK